jgi:uncharacterized tellurite resistance protein B-like protein
MLASLREFFDRRLGPEAGVPEERQRLEVATAALLVEVMRLDGAAEDERAAVLRAVQHTFGLAPDAAQEIVALADEEARESVGYYQFTSLINRQFDAAQKERVVELMWRVAYADDSLSAHEQHVIRKVADLLHVPHAAYIAAKLRARQG